MANQKVKVILLTEYKQLAILFQEAVAHLEYCGYGDWYEKSCAMEDKLPERLEKMNARIDQILKLNDTV